MPVKSRTAIDGNRDIVLYRKIHRFPLGKRGRMIVETVCPRKTESGYRSSPLSRRERGRGEGRYV